MSAMRHALQQQVPTKHLKPRSCSCWTLLGKLSSLASDAEVPLRATVHADCSLAEVMQKCISSFQSSRPALGYDVKVMGGRQV